VRTQMLVGCRSARQARRLAPWAAVVRRVEGGYRVWESVEDARTASRQR